MADEDNFDDLDIYGDGTGEEYNETPDAPADTSNAAETRSTTLDNTYDQAEQMNGRQEQSYDGSAEAPVKDEPQLVVKQESAPQTQAIASTIDTAPSALPKQAPVQQGVKRKEGTTDEREIAPGATNALLVSDLHWYQDEDDVRGWCNQAGVEDEVKEITFNEHKVNGKSKGQVFVSLQSPQAATALKSKLDSYGTAANGDSGTPAPGVSRKHTATFHPPTNPYKTLPKENPNRRGADGGQSRGGFQNRGNFTNNNRGGFNRGGMNQGTGFNQNRNFSNPSMGGGFNNNNMGGGFNSNNNMGGMGGMGGGFNNRGGFGMNRGGGGGMMNRGGRGAMMGGMGGMGMPMGGNMMPGMMGGMGGMGMAGMNMGMPNMMGGGFPQGQFNQPNFQGNMGGGEWNNHPNKRQRQE